MPSQPRLPSLRAADSGFTLIEIMVVIVILGLLATLVVQHVETSAAQARLAKATADVRTIASAVSLYRTQKGRLPESLATLVEKDERGGRYLDRIELDPWQNAYVLRADDPAADWSVASPGPDGSDGSDDDITSH